MTPSRMSQGVKMIRRIPSALADALEEAVPADRLEEAHGAVVRGGAAGPPDDEGAALDEVPVDEAPDARVGRIVPVVAHDEHVAGGHDGARKIARPVNALLDGRVLSSV